MGLHDATRDIHSQSGSAKAPGLGRVNLAEPVKNFGGIGFCKPNPSVADRYSYTPLQL